MITFTVGKCFMIKKQFMWYLIFFCPDIYVRDSHSSCFFTHFQPLFPYFFQVCQTLTKVFHAGLFSYLSNICKLTATLLSIYIFVGLEPVYCLAGKTSFTSKRDVRLHVRPNGSKYWSDSWGVIQATLCVIHKNWWCINFLCSSCLEILQVQKYNAVTGFT